MKPPKSKMAELGPNATGGEKSNAETAESAEFKMTELGPIPKDWEVKRLGEICSEYAYGTGAESVDYDGKNKYIRITDIDEDSHLYSPSTLVSPSFFSEGHIVKDNDLLVARTGASVGKTYFYSKRDGKLIFAGFLMKANVKHAEGKFIFYWTLTDYYKRWVLSESARSGQPGINIRQLQSLLLPLPPLAEQRRIAGALSDVDELISALGKLIEKKRNIKTGTMQQLLTGKTRLPGFGADSLSNNHSHAEVSRGRGFEFKQTELGPIPVDWEVKRIDQCGDVVTGSTPPRGVSELWGGCFSWISAKDFKGKYIISSEEKVTEAGKKYCRTLPENSVLVTCIASIGLNAIAKRPCATNQQINAVACRGCDYEYFYYQCCFNESRLRKMAGQTAVPIIGKGQFEEFTIALPKEIKEQRAIAAVLSDIDAEIAALEADRAKYESIKQGMMQELLTGKTRLRGK